MKVIEDFVTLTVVLSDQNTLPITAMTPNYHGINFSCGCEEEHSLISTNYFLCGGFNEFFFICENEFVTLVRVRGFFKAKATSLWSCKQDIFSEVTGISFEEQ